MNIAFHPAPGRSRGDIQMVMLPGAGFAPGDFAERGFVRAAQKCGAAVDVAVASPDFDHYLDQTLVADLRRELEACGWARTSPRLWLLGISLGGMGALLYAQAYAAEIEGVVLLAPYLGTTGTVAEVARAGGFGSWQPGEIAAADGERRLLGWLQAHTAAEAVRPMLYLGYGRGDRFVQGQALLAERLPPDRVMVAEGGHDWDVWARLWREFLARAPFTAGRGER